MSENQQIASQAHHRLFAQRDVSVLDELFAEDFIEHSPLVADGRAGLRAMVEEAGEALSYTCSRELADGDLVALHGRFTGLDETPLVGFDLYRVADGRVVEHWDGLVPEAAEPNASGRTQLDGAAQPSPGEDSEGNREKVLRVLFDRGLIGQDYSVFQELTRDDVFVQHSPDIADGAEAVIGFLEQLRESGEPLVYDRVHRSVADGDFVLTHSEGSIGGQRHSYVELWRFEDGHLAEMWDAIGPVPVDEEAAHPHGIF